VADQLHPKLWLFLLTATLAFWLCIKVPFVSYFVEITLIIGFIYQALCMGIPVTIASVCGFTVLLLAAFRFFFQDVGLFAVGTYVLEVGLAGTCMGWAIRNRQKALTAVMLGALPSLLIFFLFIFNPADIQGRVFRQIDTVERLFSQATTAPDGIVNPDTKIIYDKSFAFFKKIFPAVNFVSTVLTLFVIYLILQYVGPRLALAIPPLSSLATWQMAFFWVWIFAGGLAAAFWGTSPVKTLGYNILVCVGFVFVVEGFAVLKYFFLAKQVSPMIEYAMYVVMILALSEIGRAHV
jgi:uncharacterized protein YybS (DUF2232 family)